VHCLRWHIRRVALAVGRWTASSAIVRSVSGATPVCELERGKVAVSENEDIVRFDIVMVRDLASCRVVYVMKSVGETAHLCLEPSGLIQVGNRIAARHKTFQVHVSKLVHQIMFSPGNLSLGIRNHTLEARERSHNVMVVMESAMSLDEPNEVNLLVSMADSSSTC
jgi:hypothetical protein